MAGFCCPTSQIAASHLLGHTVLCDGCCAGRLVAGWEHTFYLENHDHRQMFCVLMFVIFTLFLSFTRIACPMVRSAPQDGFS